MEKLIVNLRTAGSCSGLECSTLPFDRVDKNRSKGLMTQKQAIQQSLG